VFDVLLPARLLIPDACKIYYTILVYASVFLKTNPRDSIHIEEIKVKN